MANLIIQDSELGEIELQEVDNTDAKTIEKQNKKIDEVEKQTEKAEQRTKEETGIIQSIRSLF